MSWEQIEGRWKQLTGRVKEYWGILTDDEIDKLDGRLDQLVGVIQSKYGMSEQQAREQISGFENACRRDLEILDTVDKLIVACKDSEKGFKTAAQFVSDDLKADFTRYAGQREIYARELRGEAFSRDGDPADGSSVAGSLQRGWLNIKAAVTAGDPETVLAESVKAEESTLSAYEHALSQELPDDLRRTIQRQFNQVKVAYNTLLQHVSAVA